MRRGGSGGGNLALSPHDSPTEVPRTLGDRASRRLLICLASTSGGHLVSLETLLDALGNHERILVTVVSPHTQTAMPGVRKLYIRRISKNPANFLVNFLQSTAILIRQRPDVVISTGAGDTFPLIMLAAALGTPVVFLESIHRIARLSLTGRLAAHWIDLLLVPWPSLVSASPRAVLVAPEVITTGTWGALPENPSVVLLTGTGPRGFDRLLIEVDRLVGEGKISRDLFAQIGESRYQPINFQYERYLPHDQLIQRIKRCDLVITHDGAGSMREALRAGKPTIVVPRKPSHGEAIFGNEAELAKRFADLGWISLAEDPSDITAALARMGQAQPAPIFVAGKNRIQVLSEFLDRVASQRKD